MQKQLPESATSARIVLFEIINIKGENKELSENFFLHIDQTIIFISKLIFYRKGYFRRND